MNGGRELTAWVERALRACVLSVLIVLLPLADVLAKTEQKVLLPGTRVYLVTQDEVSGRRRAGVRKGDLVPCKVWRDVTVGGAVLIKAGTPAMARVEKVRHAQIAGVKGKLILEALETTAVDGQTVQLDGGYNKSGKNRMGLSIALGAVVALPLIFITGKPAELPKGTVFDTYTGIQQRILIPVDDDAEVVPVLSLSDLGAGFTASVDLERLQNERKPRFFHMNLSGVPAGIDEFVIDRINGEEVAQIPLEVVATSQTDEGQDVVARVKIKTLVKKFTKGINRFEVAFTEDGERTGAEVVLNIQF